MPTHQQPPRAPPSRFLALRWLKAWRPRWPRTTLRNYLVAIILAATVPLAVLTTAQILEHGHREREVMLANLRGVAKAVSVGVDREIGASVDALLVLGESDTLQRSDVPAFERRLRARGPFRPSWDRLALVGPGGRLLFDVPAPGAQTHEGPSRGELTALVGTWRADGQGDSAVWSVLDGQPPALSTWVATRTVTPEGEHFLIAARIALPAWQSLLEGSAPDAGGFVTLFDDSHRVLARTLSPDRFQSRALPPDAVAAMGTSFSGVHKTALLGGGESYVAWQRLAHGHWGIGVGVSSAAFDAAQRNAVVLTLAVAAACLMLGVGAALAVAGRVVQPLRQLVEQPAKALRNPAQNGQAEAGGVTEILHLRDAFRALELARGEARARLAKKAEEFETLFRTSPTGLAFAQDPTCRRVMSNAAMERMAPGLADPLPDPSIEFFSGGLPLPRNELPLMRAARLGDRIGETEIEIRAPGRPPRVVLASAVPLNDRQGRPRGAIGSATDVTARKLAEQERAEAMAREQQARREAEAANRAKDELLSMLGHELRNPLNAIMTSVEVLRRADPQGPLANSARTIVERQTRKLAGMVDELLDFSKIMADDVTLLKQPVDLAEIVQASVATARPAANEREQRLEITRLTPVRMLADARRMGQVLDELLNNATKYTPEGGAIEVDLRVSGNDAWLRVENNGPGIAPALAGQVFDAFVQGEPGLARSGGGMGIGLTRVRRLVELHGGTVETASVNGRTRFELRLPVLDPVEAANGLRPCRSVGVIDDNPDALSGMRSMLELAGHRVHTAADGLSGLDMLLAESPDVAVVDIGLPGIDGYEVAGRSRAAGFRGRLIAMSGYGQQRDRLRSLAEGFEEHLVKPVFPDRLLPLLGPPAPQAAPAPQPRETVNTKH